MSSRYSTMEVGRYLPSYSRVRGLFPPPSGHDKACGLLKWDEQGPIASSTVVSGIWIQQGQGICNLEGINQHLWTSVSSQLHWSSRSM